MTPVSQGTSSTPPMPTLPISEPMSRAAPSVSASSAGPTRRLAGQRRERRRVALDDRLAERMRHDAGMARMDLLDPDPSRIKALAVAEHVLGRGHHIGEER